MFDIIKTCKIMMTMMMKVCVCLRACVRVCVVCGLIFAPAGVVVSSRTGRGTKKKKSKRKEIVLGPE